MASWSAFQERPSISIPPTTINDWPLTELSEGFDPSQPWRLKRYNPGFDKSKFDNDFHARIKLYKLPRYVVSALAIHEQLERFADRRQTQFRGPPNRDGSNTDEVLHADPASGVPLQTNGSSDLRMTWVLYSNILGALYREGQLSLLDNGTWASDPLEDLYSMMRTYPPYLQNLERMRLKGDTRSDQLIPGFEWIHLLGEHLTELACSLQAIFHWCKVRDASMSAQRWKFVKNPRRYLHQPLQRLPPIVKLLVMLKGRELALEDALGDEHFQDVLIDKRLFMIKPSSFYDASLDSSTGWEGPTGEWVLRLNNGVKRNLALFRKQLQDRFDYRLLVDWGYGRLWKKMYIFLKPATAAEKEAITTVSSFMKGHSKLAWNLYAIHPLILGEVEANPCAVCLCDYEHDDIVMELFCNHHFHPACLFQYWDNENHFQNRCPECRTSQGVLQDKVHFAVEREDRCYESKGGLQGLEGFQLEAAREWWLNDVDMSDIPAYLDVFCRACVQPALRMSRDHKKQSWPGWNDIT